MENNILTTEEFIKDKTHFDQLPKELQDEIMESHLIEEANFEAKTIEVEEKEKELQDKLESGDFFVESKED